MESSGRDTINISNTLHPLQVLPLFVGAFDVHMHSKYTMLRSPGLHNTSFSDLFISSGF